MLSNKACSSDGQACSSASTSSSSCRCGYLITAGIIGAASLAYYIYQRSMAKHMQATVRIGTRASNVRVIR